ncbi:MAG: AAA family ATPase, partial [Actinomycetota bacterium]
MPDRKPLLEREDALEVLHESLTLAEAGRGSLVMVEGAAGVGKTSLLDEIGAAAAARRFTILTGRGKEREREVPLVMVEGLFRTFLRGLDEAERSTLLVGSAALAASFLDQVSEAPPDSVSLFEGLFWLTANLSERAPVAILIDDGRWVDAASMRFLSYLAARLEDLSVAVVVATRTYEPELMASVNELRQQPGCRRLQIGALSADASEGLVRAVFPQASERFCAACFEATGGNPFYLSA